MVANVLRHQVDQGSHSHLNIWPFQHTRYLYVRLFIWLYQHTHQLVLSIIRQTYSWVWLSLSHLNQEILIEKDKGSLIFGGRFSKSPLPSLIAITECLLSSTQRGRNQYFLDTLLLPQIYPCKPQIFAFQPNPYLSHLRIIFKYSHPMKPSLTNPDQIIPAETRLWWKWPWTDQQDTCY